MENAIQPGTFSPDWRGNDPGSPDLPGAGVYKGLAIQSTIASLHAVRRTLHSITWNWTDSTDTDFTGALVCIDGVFASNVSEGIQTYQASGLRPGKACTISLYAVDNSGNVSSTPVSDTARTLRRNKAAPGPVTNLHTASNGQDSITWNWTDPKNIDFRFVKVFLDGEFVTRVYRGIQSYPAHGLVPNTSYTISTRTVDYSGNVNKHAVSFVTRTMKDFTPPGPVSGLRHTGDTSISITWVWTDPVDADFARVEILIDNRTAFVDRGVREFNATGLSPDTEYSIEICTWDNSSNKNPDPVNDTARTLPPPDTTPPAPVAHLRAVGSSNTSISLAWDPPEEPDFAGVEMYLNHGSEGTFIDGIFSRYTVGGLDPDTEYLVEMYSVDTSTNINPIPASAIARTLP